MGAETLQWIFLKFCSCYRLPTYAKGIFRGLSVLEFRTQSRNEQAQMESGWELPVFFFDFAAQIRVGIFLKDGALSSLSKKKNTPNLPHPKTPKVHAHFKTFSQWFLRLCVLDPGMRRCFWMPVFLCCSTKIVSQSFLFSELLATQPRLNDFDFPRQKIPTESSLQWRSPNRAPQNPGIDKKALA